jgi:hypothetical protein
MTDMVIWWFEHAWTAVLVITMPLHTLLWADFSTLPMRLKTHLPTRPNAESQQHVFRKTQSALTSQRVRVEATLPGLRYRVAERCADTSTTISSLFCKWTISVSWAYQHCIEQPCPDDLNLSKYVMEVFMTTSVYLNWGWGFKCQLAQ